MRSVGTSSRVPIVCLHGFPDSPEGMYALADRLVEKGRKVYLPTLPRYGAEGHGEADIDVLCEELLHSLRDLEPYWLVGHDWGALLTHWIAIHWPDALAGAVTVSVPHPLTTASYLWRSPAQLWRSRYIGFIQLPWLAERQLKSAERVVRRAWKEWSPGVEPSPAYVKKVATLLQAHPKGPLAYYRQAFRPLHLVSRLQALKGQPASKVPMLYLHGERDGCVDARACEGQHAHYAHYEQRLHSGAGHFLPHEAPAWTASAVMDFVGRVELRAGSQR